MQIGCGTSRKFNRKVGARFLYFWWYQGGKKYEKYLGREGDVEAELEGARQMFSYFRRQDEELHRVMGRLEEKITVGMYAEVSSKEELGGEPPSYLPELEE